MEEIYQAVISLIKDEDHLDYLESQQSQPWLAYINQVREKACEKAVSFCTRLKDLPEEEKKSTTDCAMILKYLVDNPKPSEHPLLDAAKYILEKKK